VTAAAPEPAGPVALMMVSGGTPEAARALPGRARAAAAASIEWVQVRERHLCAAALLRLVAEVRDELQGSATRVLVNGRPDVASAAGAAGVQLPEEGLPVREVRLAFPGLVIGASRHSLLSARRAEDEGADLVLFGPVFATPGKEGRAAGAAALAEVARALRVPVFAIGGIDPATAPAARAAGARGLAAIRVFAEAPETWPALAQRLRGVDPP
jgi:thiamine-phosphate pyrophosphorylase